MEIEDNQFGGQAEEVSLENTEEAITISWEKRDDEFYSPVKGSEASLVLHCLENFKFLDLFTSDSRRYRVSIYRNTKLYWRGFVVADLYSEDFAKPPYPVNLKAVDGFNILSNKAFSDSEGKPFEGRASLWDLVYGALEQMGLELDIADWCDLYAVGMDETKSPLTQAFIEMKMLYTVYDEPTWRDVLELAVQPFAAQIFQSNGAIHIRRVVSLYNDIRPYSFYNVGAKFPSGWLVTHDGKTITTAAGQVIVTKYSRKRIESMWEGDIVIEDSSQLEIVPPLKSIKITKTNKLIENIWVPMGLFDSSNWSYPQYIAHPAPETLQFNGTENPTNEWCSFNGYTIEASRYPATIEFELKARVVHYDSDGYYYSSWRPPGPTKTAIYAITFETKNGVLYLKPGDDRAKPSWDTKEFFFEELLDKEPWEVSKNIDLPAFATKGVLRVVIQQNLQSFPAIEGLANARSDCFLFEQFTLSQDFGDDFDQELETEMVVNRSNNYEMEITMPLADIPQIPNAKLTYAMYLVDASGVPTQLWHSRGRRDYGTLQHHLVQCALRFKRLAAKRIAANTFTGVHIDMNTVLQDDKFLNVGYYVNAIALSCLSDKFDIEFMELPGLLATQKPEPGDDCVTDTVFDLSIKKAVRCGSTIVVLDATGVVWSYDVVWGKMKNIHQATPTTTLWQAPKHFVLIDGQRITVLDERGKVSITKTITESRIIDGPATYILGNIYYSSKQLWRDGETWEYRINVVNEEGGESELMISLIGKTERIACSEFSVGYSYLRLVNDRRAIISDRRVGGTLHTQHVVAIPTTSSAEVVALSDRVLCAADHHKLSLYRRPSLAASDVVHVRDEAALPTFVDASYAQAAFVAPNGAVSLWDEPTNTVYQAINAKGSGSPLAGVMLIEGTLYIVRDNGIYHLVQ